jgi:hypothetical protein
MWRVIGRSLHTGAGQFFMVMVLSIVVILSFIGVANSLDKPKVQSDYIVPSTNSEVLHMIQKIQPTFVFNRTVSIAGWSSNIIVMSPVYVGNMSNLGGIGAVQIMIAQDNVTGHSNYELSAGISEFSISDTVSGWGSTPAYNPPSIINFGEFLELNGKLLEFTYEAIGVTAISSPPVNETVYLNFTISPVAFTGSALQYGSPINFAVVLEETLVNETLYL